MYISNDETQNYPFCILKLVVESMNTNKTNNQNWLKSPTLLSRRIRIRCFKTFGTSVINSTFATPSLGNKSILISWPG